MERVDLLFLWSSSAFSHCSCNSLQSREMVVKRADFFLSSGSPPLTFLSLLVMGSFFCRFFLFIQQLLSLTCPTHSPSGPRPCLWHSTFLPFLFFYPQSVSPHCLNRLVKHLSRMSTDIYLFFFNITEQKICWSYFSQPVLIPAFRHVPFASYQCAQGTLWHCRPTPCTSCRDTLLWLSVGTKH